jgi:Tfp pilus assembly major pilin PilA
MTTDLKTQSKEKLLQWANKFDIEKYDEVLEMCIHDYKEISGKKITKEDFPKLVNTDRNTIYNRIAKTINGIHMSNNKMAKDLKIVLED